MGIDHLTRMVYWKDHCPKLCRVKPRGARFVISMHAVKLAQRLIFLLVTTSRTAGIRSMRSKVSRECKYQGLLQLPRAVRKMIKGRDETPDCRRQASPSSA